MSEYAKTALEILKLAPRYLVSLGIISALFVFTPDKTLKWFGVFDFAQHYRAWFAIAFIVTGVLFAVDRTIAVVGWIRHKEAVAKATKARLERLHRLTEDEKQILRFYFAKETKTNVLRIDDGVVQGLVAARIIYQSASMGHILDGFAHNISDFAWDYLHEHIELLDGTTDTYRTDKRRDLFDII
ncbi:MAG: superinfection exclusion B family protein [Verrucomicrobia bacterium]|nr:superinfection exclusion B family protein [Verrucomicrobiota bacterium]